ncbi:N-acetyltransferase family protein [Ferrovibrio sp.]|uniref:GNAT family N-acetyltransferase n=1 Tax=Ferrovibrio sp. TaxID=1917215 RepID=UPI003518D9CB
MLPLQSDVTVLPRTGLVVRLARAEDIPALLSLGRLAHCETHYHFVPFDEAKVMTTVARFLTNTERHCVFIAEWEGRLVGFLAGLVEDYFFSSACYARDIIFYIDASSRGTALARQLVSAFTIWARRHGALEVQVGVSSGRKVDRAGQFLQRCGFTAVGGLYKRRLLP